VVGAFMASDNTCPNCRNGYQSACVQGEFAGSSGAQAEAMRVPLADGTLIATPEVPDRAQLPDLLAASDVLGTGWFAAVAADVQPKATVAVVGDGAVGLMGVLAARELGAERIIAMSRHESRQKLARVFGATDIVTERGEDGIAAVQELTGGFGADSVLECVGTSESMGQALRSARPGGAVGFVGVPHGVNIDGAELFGSLVRVQGGTAPVRRFLPRLIESILAGRIQPGLVFDLDLPLAEAAEGYAAMAQRRAIKSLLRP
jgi:threonine dehydrogenase-like Zn-dependent dehydrogenase